MQVNCECTYKSYNENSRTYTTIETESNYKNNDISNSNFKVIECGGEIFKNTGKNASFWILLIGLIINFFIYIVYSF